MGKKYICAVGDSFMHGVGLVQQYDPKFWSELTESDQGKLGYCQVGNDNNSQYYSKLEKLRFSSLVADNIDADHINYAVGGSSQEGIKFQAYMLMRYLKRNNIPMSDTIWLIGLTAKTRMMLFDYNFDNRDATEKDWSQLSRNTLFLDKDCQDYPFNKLLTKELTLAMSDQQLTIDWCMNIMDTINLLKVEGVDKYVLLNMFVGLGAFYGDTNVPVTIDLLRPLIEPLAEHIIPSSSRSYYDDSKVVDFTQCKHPGIESQNLIANSILSHLDKKQWIK